MKENGASLGICDISIVDVGGKKLMYNRRQYKDKIEILSREDAFSYISKFLCFQSSATKLYHKTIFKNLRFPEGRTNEDQFIVHHVLDLCSKIVFLHEEFYYYVQHDNSICGNLRRNIGLERDINDFIYAINDRYNFFQSIDLSEMAHNALIAKYGYIMRKLSNENYFQHNKLLNINISITIKQLLSSKYFKDKLRAVKMLVKLLKRIYIDRQ